MPSARLSRFTLLPELELEKMSKVSKSRIIFKARKVSKFEVCPKCATKSDRIYDHREVKIQDAPLRGRKITLLIRKRRFECPGCTSVFTEPVPGISKGKRFTQRFKAHEQWPQVIGIDEHSFKKNKVYRHMEFVTMLVDHRNKRTIDMVHGKSGANLKDSLRYIPKRSNVNWVTMDLSQTFRRFSKDFFPRAQIVADKFHVVRLLDNHINKYRKAITGDQRKNPIRKLLLKNEINLDYWKKSIIQKWLSHHPDLREIYFLKQALHRLYRTKGYNKASKAFTKLTDRMGRSKLREVLTLRKTLLSWRSEILNYFKTRLTNARVEGFNNKAKLIKRRAYGYKSFKNYRLRVLNACC